MLQIVTSALVSRGFVRVGYSNQVSNQICSSDMLIFEIEIVIDFKKTLTTNYQCRCPCLVRTGQID